MAKHLKSILAVSLTTLGSRVLGLARDSLAGFFFGTGGVNSAFSWAFTVPNLFRRLVGEGALSSAFIPVLSEAHEEGGRFEAFRFLNQVLSRLFLVLLALVMVGVSVMFGLGLAAGAAAQYTVEVQHLAAFFGKQITAADWSESIQRWQLGCHFGVTLMPYLLLVCLTAALLGALNILGHYAISGMSQVWLNISMIVSLGGFGWYFGRTDLERMYWQCGGVLFGGLLQVTMPTLALWREGWRPRWDWTWSPRLREMTYIFLPGLFGASIIQINIVVSRCVAFGLNESATTVLYYSQRLMELPLGMFTVAFATVLFPRIALLAAQGDKDGMARTYSQGLRLILAITVPAALGLVALRVPIVRVLYEHGKFGEDSVAEVAPVLAISAMGIPFFSMATLSIRGFYAQKDMRTPVHVAKLDFFLNLGLTLILMIPFGTCGLAMANLSSSIFQTVMLQRLLRKRGTALARPQLGGAVLSISLAGAGMLVFTLAGWWALRAGLGTERSAWLLHMRACDLVAVLGLIPGSVLVYLALLRMAKFEDWPQLRELADQVLRRDRA
jgi:putative peptidoglycan lipid II flippase